MKNRKNLILIVAAILAAFVLLSDDDEEISFPQMPPGMMGQPMAQMQQMQVAYLQAMALRAQQLRAARAYGGGSYLRSMTHTNGRRSYVGGSGETSYFLGKNGNSVMVGY